MRCKYCGAKVADESPFCPACGFTLKATASRRALSARGAEADEEGSSPGLLWYVALSLLASALLLATVGLGLLGVRDGLDYRRNRDRELSLQYYQRGQAHLEDGNCLLALAEFEEAVRLAPDFGEARHQLALVQALLEDRAIPTSEALGGAVAVLFEEARALHADDRWEEAIVKLEQLRRLDSGYRKPEVEEMLFDAHSEQARALTDAGELERALAHADSALGMRPDDPTASELRLALSLYLAGLTQWGADWERAVDTFEQIYSLNPSFLDVAQKLHEAYVHLGDVYYAEGAWCVAEGQYGAALQIATSLAVTSKRDQARRLCVEAVSSATPTPMPAAAPAGVVSPTVTVASPPLGGFAGRFMGYVDVDPVEMRVRVRVVDGQGDEMPGMEVGISAYDWLGDIRSTDANGYCEFSGLTQETEFTVRLTQVSCDPVQFYTRWGAEALVEFVERHGL